MSLTPQISYDVNTDAPAINDGKDDDTGSVLARTTNAAIIAKESNFNLVYDDFNVASVSMLFIYIKLLFVLIWFISRNYIFMSCVMINVISRQRFKTLLKQRLSLCLNNC